MEQNTELGFECLNFFRLFERPAQEFWMKNAPSSLVLGLLREATQFLQAGAMRTLSIISVL